MLSYQYYAEGGSGPGGTVGLHYSRAKWSSSTPPPGAETLYCILLMIIGFHFVVSLLNRACENVRN